MRIVTFIVIAILCSSFGRAQDRFFTFVEGWQNNAAIETSEGFTLLGLGNASFTPGDHYLRYNIIDANGQISDFIEFEVDSAIGTSSRGQSSMLIQLPDGIYLAAGILVMQSSPFQYGVTYKYDVDNGIITVNSAINDADITQFWGMSLQSDTTYLVIGSRSNGLNIDSRIYCFRISDNALLWTNDFFWGGEQQRTHPVQVYALTSGHIAALFWEHDLDQPAFHDRWRTRLSLMDENGQVLWTRYPGDHVNYRIRPGGITEQDGDILVAFSDPEYYDETGEWQAGPNRVRFERYTTTGEISYQDSLIEQPDDILALRVVTQILPTTDGNFIVAGYHTNKHGYLSKITPDYETIWFERYLPHEYGEETGIEYQELQILNVIETSDGGYLCTGTYFSDPGSIVFPNGIQTAIALKVDEFGCLVENCTVGISEFQVQDSRLELFPNPVSSSLNVRIPYGNAVNLVMLVDAMGRVIDHSRFQISRLSSLQSVQGSQSDNLESLSLNLESLPAGLYTIIITSDEGGLYSGKFMKE